MSGREEREVRPGPQAPGLVMARLVRTLGLGQGPQTGQSRGGVGLSPGVAGPADEVA